MTIQGQGLGKKFGKNWIFKNLNFKIDQSESVAIIGPNGSGKSTLLQTLIGAATATKGQLVYWGEKREIEQEKASGQISFSAPYVDLVEELTLSEHLEFHSNFKQPVIEHQEMINHAGLSGSEHKRVSAFSSGMKQRLKLVLQFYFENEVIALDEPTSNLDESGCNWYKNEIQKLMSNRTIIVASNDLKEYDFCKKIIDVSKAG